MKKDRNGDTHNSGIDNPDFALDNPFAISVSDGHEEEWSYFPNKEDGEVYFKTCVSNDEDVHFYEYNKEYGYEVIDSHCPE